MWERICQDIGFLEALHLLTRDPVLKANKQDKNVFNFHS